MAIKPETEYAPSIDALIAGAIYDFAAYLTTRNEVVTCSRQHDASPMARVVGEFIDFRGVDMTNPPVVVGWNKNIKDLQVVKREKV